MDLVDSALTIVRKRVATLESDYVKMLQLTESPVEQIFFAAAIDYFSLDYHEDFKRGQATLTTNYPPSDGIFTLWVEPQAKIPGFDFEYRADFLFSLYRYASEGKPRLWGRTVVEIDGHDFHERTKQQASRDKKRDRDLLAEGYYTLRFTGSDIFNDPYSFVEEVWFHMDKCAQEAFDSFEQQGSLNRLLWGG